MNISRGLRYTGAAIALALAGPAGLGVAQEEGEDEPVWPLASGDFWEVTGIDVKDGGGYRYAEHIATRWKESQDFAVSQGWIKEYMVLANIHGRADEPDLYLITVMEDMPTGPEWDERGKAYRDWAEASMEELVEQSGNRAEFRKVLGTSLLQELRFHED